MKRKLAEHRVPLLSNAWQYNTRTLWCLWWHHEERRCFQFNENPSFQRRRGRAVPNRMNGWETSSGNQILLLVTSLRMYQIHQRYSGLTGVTVKYSRRYAEIVCKVLSKNSQHLSQYSHGASVSLNVSVKITDSSTWLWTSQSALCSFRWLQPSVCRILELGPEWCLCFLLFLPFASAHCPLGLGVNCSHSWESPGSDEVRQEEVEETFLPTGVSTPQPEPDRGLPCVLSSTFLLCSILGEASSQPSTSSSASILPAMSLNSFLAFWNCLLFPLFSNLLI